MFQFDRIDGMIKFWGPPKVIYNEPTKVAMTVTEESCIAKSYLVTEYLKQIWSKISWTLADLQQDYANHFCIVDRDTLDLFWYKYNFYQEYQKKITGRFK